MVRTFEIHDSANSNVVGYAAFFEVSGVLVISFIESDCYAMDDVTDGLTIKYLRKGIDPATILKEEFTTTNVYDNEAKSWT